MSDESPSTPQRTRIVSANRDVRQNEIAKWACDSFGVEQATSLPQRAIRLLEESIELLQAAGGDPAMAHKLIDFVFSRPVGEIRQELGGIGVCLLVFAEAAGVSAEVCEAAEVERIKSKPTSHYTARNAAKNAAGFLTTTTTEPDAVAEKIPGGFLTTRDALGMRDKVAMMADDLDAYSLELDRLNHHDGTMGSIIQITLSNFTRKLAGMVRKVSQ